METHVVQPIGLALTENLYPRFLVCRGITRLGETAILHGATQPNGMAVHIDLPTFHTNSPHAKGRLIIVIPERDADTVDSGMILVPDIDRIDEIHVVLDVRFRTIPTMYVSLAWIIAIFHHSNRIIIVIVIEPIRRERTTGIKAQMHTPGGQVWPDTYLFNIQVFRLSPQFHRADDTIPIALCLVGHRMRILTHAHVLDTVIYANRDGVALSDIQPTGNVTRMGRRKRHLVLNLHPVHVDCRLDMRALQEQHHPPILPRRWHIHALLIPGIAHIVRLGCQEEGELHVTLHPILLHIGIEIVRRVVERARPLGLHRHRIALAVGQQRPWQHHIVIVMQGIAQRQLPVTCQIDGLLSPDMKPSHQQAKQ